MSRRDRIRAKIEARSITVDGPLDTPCRLWTGPTSGDGKGGGYGRMNLDGGTVAVHITSWVIDHGPLPPRKQLDHKCRNRLCWADDHLEMVTHKQNQKRRDAARKFECEPVELSMAA